MLKYEQRVTLKAGLPRSWTLLNAAGLFLVFCLLVEAIGRSAAVQDRMPYQAYGMNHTQLEIEITDLDKFVRERGAPDCFIFGSSQAFREIDPDVFAQTYEAAGGEHLNCYNFGVTGSQVATTSILNKIIIKKYKPRLVIIGTSFLDYTQGRELQIDERFKENDWLEYKTGKFTISGWLTEHSQAWRALTLLSYAAPYSMNVQEVLREAHKWDGEIAESGFALSQAFINPLAPVEEGFVKNMKDEFGDFSASERNLAALEEIIQTSQQEGAAVLITEMAYHPALLDLKDNRGNPRMDREQILAFQNKINGLISGIAQTHSVQYLEFDASLPIPADGWFDLYHLNYKGAQVYSQWLGAQAASLIAPLPPDNSTQGN